MKIKLQTLAMALAATFTVGAASADDNAFKFGVTEYTTHSKTNGVTGIGVPPGADAETGNATTVIFVDEPGPVPPGDGAAGADVEQPATAAATTATTANRPPRSCTIISPRSGARLYRMTPIGGLTRTLDGIDNHSQDLRRRSPPRCRAA